MKNKMKFIIVVSLVFIMLSAPFLQADAASSKNISSIGITHSHSRQDGSTLQKLQWYAPNGILPGTYAEYLKNHPLTPAWFTTPTDLNDGVLRNYSYAILVNTTLYPRIVTNLTQYLDDLSWEGYTVYVQTVSGGTPEDIKAWVKTQNNAGASGVLFIGDITAAWVKVADEVFPSDLFYMDLDGNWSDTDHDGIYDSHTDGTGDMAPEVYVGRINAHTLDYDSEENMVNDYFAKVHAYRTGSLTQQWRGLEYIEEDWYDMDVYLNQIYGANVSRFDYGYFTTAQDYLHQISLGQYFTQVCVHSYSGGHCFGTRPTESAAYANVYIYSPTSRPGKLLLGCDDGIKAWLNGLNVITEDRYGGWVADQFSANVNLLAGWNQLLLKISQEGGDYKFSARFTDVDGTTFPDLIYQIKDPSSHGGEAPYIRSFLLNGFHQDVSDNFWNYLSTDYLGGDETTLDPHDGDVTNGTTWSTYNSGNPYINMADYCNGAQYGVCYAYARVYADAQTSCQLWMGYDDGARVWLNGNQVLLDNRYGGFTADMTKVNVTLQPGENRLMVKISQWMGDHGFSARFCNSDGSEVAGLTCDPASTPMTYVGTWLFDGPYANPDKSTRLSKDYLGNETTVTPDEGTASPFGNWTRGIGEGCPFNIGGFYDHAAWVFSQDIQNNDPPVLFYNLFACGPGRFTDQDYLAGSYIFHTTTGLITIASAKSGSMLNFDDFTKPLSEGKSIGESFKEWFITQAPYVEWEKEWYYGLVALGDPTLCVIQPMKMKITRPDNGVYLVDKKVLPFPAPLVFGRITINASIQSQNYGIQKVEFYVDDALQQTVTAAPYEWTWTHWSFFKHVVKVVAYDTGGHKTARQVTFWRFF
ncbi:MAG TPA: Ig-like domain-containing protein [Candidatus Thermoplasmatota archaeon]|nr:Ig-like domain-containing protein [Candidatus Thermoplasmatota archaeon]